jgi:RNA polymerase sigma factor (sigma-70 family)
MKGAFTIHEPMTAEQNQQIERTVQKERRRLLDFIRKRVPREEDAEDILQDVFYELVESYRVMEPIEKVSAWLFRVTRNKITDMFRKKKPEPLIAQAGKDDDGEEGARLNLADLLPDEADGPEAIYVRKMMLNAMAEALGELPREQREVFVMHELEDMSFKEISAITEVQVNTLLSRKRYAVMYLRETLKVMYDDFINTI